MKRTLHLKKERLVELSTDELRDVAGAELQATPLCPTNIELCNVSRWAESLCGCLTSYCSIDIC